MIESMKTFQAYLPPGGRTYSCVHCRAHLANHDELISKVSYKHFHISFSKLVIVSVIWREFKFWRQFEFWCNFE